MSPRGYLPSIIVDGTDYVFVSNERKDGQRILKYLENSMDLHFIIRSEARNRNDEVVPGYVGVYISEADKSSDAYFNWWKATIQSLAV
ncbi:MAG: hypothetical protein HYV65_00660 [Candidatus Spechtbacteria bacterium]|nr:hypothetical protein [Candidatus Spechtbacteria bacterium]